MAGHEDGGGLTQRVYLIQRSEGLELAGGDAFENGMGGGPGLQTGEGGEFGTVMAVIVSAQNCGIEIAPFIETRGSASFRLVERMAGSSDSDDWFAGGDVLAKQIKMRFGKIAAADGNKDHVGFADHFNAR